jgi:ABC-type lipoprotein release transport system permease subunit
MTALAITRFQLLALAAPVCLAVLLGAGRAVPWRYNLRNLAVRWRTTLATALAFILVVALLLAMLAFVNGLTRLVEGTGHPGNVLVLSAGATDELVSSLALADVGDIENQPGILRDDKGRPLCSREVYVAVGQSAPGAGGQRPRRRLVQLRGIEDPEVAARVHGLELLGGGAWFSPAGARAIPGAGAADPAPPAVEAVLGEGIARAWRLSVGDVFEVGPRRWLVVGITRSAGTAFGSEVWAKRQLVGQLFGKDNAYTSLVLRTADASSARSVSDNLTRDYKRAALRALPENDYYAKLAAANQVFLGAAYAVAVVMAAGGVFGVMNTMFAAVSQRARDIGVLRVLGFTRRQVLASFLAESLAIALAGGGVGCLLGCLAQGWTATSFVHGRSLVFTLTVDGDTLAVGLLFTLSMGGAGGFLPALAAMAVKPLESLR